MDREEKGFKVVDRRGEEKKQKEKVAPDKVIRSSINGETYLKCPGCKRKRPAKKYLPSKQLALFVCLKCGCAFMQPEFARQVYEEVNRTVKSV